jgi:putative membrane protein
MYSRLALALLASSTIAFGASAQGTGQTTPAPGQTTPGQTQPTPRTGQTTPRPADSQAKSPSRATASATDSSFVMKAAEGGAKEVEAGKLASTRAANSDVKAFAQRMVKDHTKANGELTTLANSKQIDVKTKSADSKELTDRLAKQSGAAFDKAYMDEMVKDHQTTVALFERQSRDGDDAELKAWAGKQLPVLREHLKMAQDIQGKLGSTSSRQ